MAAEIEQLRGSMDQLNAHNQRIATAHDELKITTEHSIGLLRLQLAAADAKASAAKHQDKDDCQLVDLKTVKPPVYGAERTESYKMFNKKFKAFADSRREGFRDALEWVEKQSGVMDLPTIQSMQWNVAEVANKKLYNILIMLCSGEALVIVENHKNMGFEAWRKLKERFDPMGETFVFDKLTNLMRRERCKDIKELPAAIGKWELEMRRYEEQSGKKFPEELQMPILLTMVPTANQKDVYNNYRMGSRKNYAQFSNDLIEFANNMRYDARMISGRKGPDDMDVDAAERERMREDNKGQEYTDDE